jgi:hypothetical protein
MNVRMAALIALVSGGLGLGVIWLLLGSQISLLIDSCLPGNPLPQPMDPLSINADSFILGSRSWPLPRSGKFKLKTNTDTSGRLILSTDEQQFILGPVQQIWPDPATPQYSFLPDLGDVVSFTRDVSSVSWATPFHFSIIGPLPPTWHRYAYDRLRWTKSSGATLEITWRDQQHFYRNSGWMDSYTNQLTKLHIHPSPLKESAIAYLSTTRVWTPAEYRLEIPPTNSQEQLVTVIYSSDQAPTAPGSGK